MRVTLLFERELTSKFVKIKLMPFLRKVKKFRKGSKGWWDVTNKISGRKCQTAPIGTIINPNTINEYFQSINTDPHYIVPQPLPIPSVTRIPSVDEHTIRTYLISLKPTASGPDQFPY